MITKYLKYLIPILFALAIALGLIQREKTTYQFQNSQNKLSLSSEAQTELWAFYNKGQALANPQPTEAKPVTFLAVGDIMLSRKVALKIQQNQNPLLPFSQLSELLNSTDFNLGNLETPFAEKPTIGGDSLIFASPTSSLTGLIENKFKVLNLANNHALDKGVTELNFTQNLLQKNNILTTGVGENLQKAWEPAIVETKGIKICFVGASYASINDNGKTHNDYVARIEDTENLKLSIEKSKSMCDYIVATMHAGTEYTRKPNQNQINFAYSAIDLGADMVIGHHPHWIQTIEKYKNKYIFYSLGNFIFDQMWSQETREGLALKIQISKPEIQNELQGSKAPANLDSIELIPIIIDNYSTPRLATPIENKMILEKIGEKNNILK